MGPDLCVEHYFMTFAVSPSKAGTYTIACIETTSNEKHYDVGEILTVTASAEN